MSLILAALLAQVGPSVSPGAGGALPQAPLEIPRKTKAASAPVPLAVVSPQQECQRLAQSDPLAAIDLADDWLQRVKGAPLADPAQCKALALGRLERWDQAEALFVTGRDALPVNEKRRRAELGAGAAIAAEEQAAFGRAIGYFEVAGTDASASGDAALTGRIARDRANSLFKLGRREEATASLAQARAALPDDAATWLISARLARRQDQLSEAQMYILRAAALDPRDPEIGLEAGLIAVLEGHDEAARLSWQSVTQRYARVRRGQKSGAPHSGRHGLNRRLQVAADSVHDDERREILGHIAQAVGEPRPDAGPSADHGTRLNVGDRGLMIDLFRIEGLHNRDVVHHLCGVREELRYPGSTPTVLREFVD